MKKLMTRELRPDMSPDMRPRSGKTRAQQSGFGLVELMISMGLGLLLVSAVIGVFVKVNRTSDVLQQTNQVQDDVFFLTETVRRSMRLAGHRMVERDRSNGKIPFSSMTTAFPAEQPFMTSASAPAYLQSFGWQSAQYLGVVPGGTLTGGAILVRYYPSRTSGEPPCWVNAATYDPDQLYSTAIVWDAILERFDCYTTDGAITNRVEIAKMNRPGSSNTNPSRMDFIEVTYGVDIDEDGAVDAYVPSATLVASGRWDQVMSTEMTMVISNTDRMLAANEVTQSYKIIDSTTGMETTLEYTDGAVRRLAKMSMSIRNAWS